ncbi:MAG: ABATE domain-containing protein [Candidatus Latescibacterota bacterium]|nr:MAG: ABATE domain-containing protein [Candidatus Latescibacterota bacterium]
MSGTPLTIGQIDRCGNAPALDFVNTVHSRLEIDTHDYLQDYAALAQWAREGGLVSTGEHRELVERAAAHPGMARRVLQRAIELREVMYRLFSSVIRGEDPMSSDVETLNKSLGAALSRRRVRRVGDAFDWSWDPGRDQLDRPLWPVILSAADLLAAGDKRRLKECPAPDGCGWLFLDTSKNGTRKWCNMRTCGNIAKARRYYKRHSKNHPTDRGQ